MAERSLAGRRVVVVGASAGIGRALAVRAGKEGAKLVMAARREDKLAMVAALSSDSVRHPHTALGAYSSSKSALERCLVSWRLEKPGYRFSCVEVSGTVPTDFASAFDPELLGVAATEWIARGLVQENR